MNKYYIGLMSGTSMDAVDAALVDFSAKPPQLIATHKTPISDELRGGLNRICETSSPPLTQLAELDTKVAHLFTETVQGLLKKTSLSKQDILAIGSHGQTLFHYPNAAYPFSIQIGNPHIIAEETGITTVADFRRRDLAAGGQGAPLTPAFHQYLFQTKEEDRFVVNLGGIANLTYLPASSKAAIIGFDSGPANVLLDKWIQKHQQKWFDEEGTWAANHTFDTHFLQQLLADPYFQLAPPKSTGHEYFNLAWLNRHLETYKRPLSAGCVQATLCELTAVSIAKAIHALEMSHGRILLCGGGSKNSFLKQRLSEHCMPHQLQITDQWGAPSEWLEAMAFAWFAKQTLEGKPSNLPQVTGAKTATILGSIHLKS